MPEPFVIPLSRPAGPKGREITELRLREPTAGEVMLASRETGRAMALSLLAQVTGCDAAVIEALPARASDRALAHLTTSIGPVDDEAADEATEPADELTVDLPEVLEIGTATVSRLTLREPTLGELIKGEKYHGMQRTLVLVSLVSGLPRAVVEKVPISAFAKAAAYVMLFTDAAPMTGGVPLDV